MPQKPFHLVHMDMCRPHRVPDVSGAQSAHYFLTMLDDCTQTTWTFLMHDKSQVAQHVKHFLAYAENHFGTCIKVARECVFHLNVMI